MLTFYETLQECLGNKELVFQFNRLSGCKLGIDDRSALDKKIDEVTGYHIEVDKEQMYYMDLFVGFVMECIWERLTGLDVGVEQNL